MITGLDETSQKCLNALATGHGPTDLVGLFNISIDQAKRLSRLYKLHTLAELHLTPELFTKLKGFGQKALMWSNLFKEEDWDGLAELITATDFNTKRDTYTHMVEAVKEKRQRIDSTSKKYQNLLKDLQDKEHEIAKIKAKQQDYLDQSKALIDEINSFPEDVQSVLLEAVARLQEDTKVSHWLNTNDSFICRYVLTRRLTEDWQAKMKKAKILFYDEYNYIWYIRDIEAFASQIQDRLKNKRKKIFYEGGPKSTHYRFHGSRIHAKLREDMETLDQKLQQLEAEKIDLGSQLNQVKKKNPKSFLENILLSNQLSAKDIETHGRLQAQGLKWLFNREFVAVAELVHCNRRFDVVGFSKDGRIIIIEVKASIEDFRRDSKWQEYLLFCDELYFLIQDNLSFYRDFDDLDKKGAGLLALSEGGRIKEVYGAPPTTETMTEETRRDLMFEISRLASRWATYGFTPNNILSISKNGI
jgi:hypothetical protein